MKRAMILIFLLICMVGFSGCVKGVESCPVASDNMITSDMLSQNVYDALQADWDEWNEKSEMEQMISSRMPGNIYRSFDTWAECEEFLGFEVFNPLEDSEFTKGTFVGMPEGFNDASRIYVSVYGTKEGEVQRISVESGYRDGDIRITVRVGIHPDKPLELTGEQMITEDSGERYVATSKVVVIGPVSYNIRVVGEENRWKEVRETLSKVLPYFEDTTDSKTED